MFRLCIVKKNNETNKLYFKKLFRDNDMKFAIT